MKPLKTESGNVAFKARSSLMSVRQRAVFLLCDGNRSMDSILAATDALGAVRDDFEHLLAQGFLEVPKPPVLQEVVAAPAAASPAEAPAVPGVPPQSTRKGRNLDLENWTMF